MSCYRCTDDTIKAVATWSLNSRYKTEVDLERTSERATVLAYWNDTSVDHRYNDGSSDEKEILTVSYNQHKTARAIPPVDILQLCACLEYQSCEPENWKEGAGYKILQEARGNAISHLPGIDQAPWGLPNGYLNN